MPMNLGRVSIREARHIRTGHKQYYLYAKGQLVGKIQTIDNRIGYYATVHGKGYIREALAMLLPQIPRQYRQLYILAVNAKSIRVAEKCGFTLASSAGEYLIFRHETYRPLSASQRALIATQRIKESVL